MRNSRMWRGVAAVTIAVAMTACSDGSVSRALVPGNASLAFIGDDDRGNQAIRTAEREFVEVCKDYVMTTGATPPTASFTANGNAFTLTDGECKEVWVKGGSPEAVNVTETAIAGYITTYKVTEYSGSVTGPTAGYSATVFPGGDPAAGQLIEFVNTEEVNTGGCTLTQGYWKTHSSYGPATPADPIWSTVGGPGATFYYSGMSWYTLFWTAPKGGNPYIQLAHQYMAAVLNVNNGATPAPAQLALATAFFNNAANTPSTAYSKSATQTIRGWASALGSFNEGTTGPGHCQD